MKTRFERVGDNTIRITDGPGADDLAVMLVDDEGNDLYQIPATYEGDSLVLTLLKPLHTVKISLKI